MNNPSQNVLTEFNKIKNSYNSELSLNWCEKRKAWGVLAYERNIGSYWIAFILINRYRK